MTKAAAFRPGLWMALLLLMLSFVPVATYATQQACEDMAETNADAEARCPGLWGTCCDFGAPPARMDAEANARTRAHTLVADLVSVTVVAQSIDAPVGVMGLHFLDASGSAAPPSLKEHSSILRL